MTLKALIAALSLSVFALSACDKTPAAPEEQPLAKRPAKADPKDWCAPHDVPESMCTQCNPALVDRYKAAGDFCEEHGYPESVCPKCNPLAAPEGMAKDHHGEGAK